VTYLKHTYNLLDEQVCARWVENPYWQFFCGFDYLQHQLPIDPSSLTRWRERIGSDGMELLLSVTVVAAVKPGSLERVSVDTTVQPQAIAYPLDAWLHHRGREILVRLAARHGIKLRQSISGWERRPRSSRRLNQIDNGFLRHLHHFQRFRFAVSARPFGDRMILVSVYDDHRGALAG
jgi:hypothetical protein